MWKEKLGNYLIDVSKYFLTGVFVASLVKDLEEIRWLIYVLSGSVAAVLLLLGLILTNKRRIMMGSLIILGMVGIPCLVALLWFLTPSGKRWLKDNHMI